MAASKATALVFVISCALMPVAATTNQEPAVTDESDLVDRKNVTDELAVCPPSTYYVGVRYVVATFNFSHVQTPFIVAAWILFVTLAKIGMVMSLFNISMC